VRVAAIRTAIDLQRHRGTRDEQKNSSPGELATVDPELDYLKQRYRDTFNAAIRRAIAALGTDQRDILRRHFVEGLTLDDLAAQARVHRVTIARRIAAARQAVGDEAHRLLEAELRANGAEVDSLARIMRSQLDLSLPGLLQDREAGMLVDETLTRAGA
jgi:RNA polymerase sigma-70 factor (ECF subfamily)